MYWLILMFLLLPSLAWSQTTNSRVQAGDGTPITDSTSGRLDVTVQNPVTVTGTVTITDGVGAVNVIVDSSALPSGASTEATLGTLLLNSTFTGRLPAAFASAENIAAQTATAVHGLGYMWDGAAWDRLQGNSTDGLLVNLGANNDVTITGSVTVTDGAGALNVICDSGCSGGTQYNQGTATTDTDALGMTGAVRRDTAAVATGVIDGDRLALSTDSVGRLRVTAADTTQPVSGTVTVTDGAGALNVICDSGCSGSSFADNAAFTFGTTTIGNMGAVVDDVTTNAVTENSAGAPRMNTNRILYTAPTGSTGTALYTAPVALGDDTSNPTTGGVAVYMMCFDGTLWDRCRGTVIDTDDNLLSASQATSLIINLDHVYNGTNWTRSLSAANALNSTGSGLQAAQLVGQFDDTTPTAITENQFGNLRMSANRNLFGTIRDAAGNERGANVNASNQLAVEAVGTLADDGVAAATNRLGVLPGIAQASSFNSSTAGRNTALNTTAGSGSLMVAALPEPSFESYSASFAVASAASATDIAILPGNATNTVLITEVRVSCTQTTAGIIQLHLIKRSAANSAGTSSGMTEVPDDANYSASDSAGLIYTANPTPGATVGDIDVVKLGCMATGTATPNDIYIGNFRQKPIVLRGTAQGLAVNLNAATVTGGSFAITYKWLEVAGL